MRLRLEDGPKYETLSECFAREFTWELIFIADDGRVRSFPEQYVVFPWTLTGDECAVLERAKFGHIRGPAEARWRQFYLEQIHASQTETEKR